MIGHLAKRAAPLAVLAIGSSLSGCAYIIGDLHEVDGVPLQELDVSAPAPERIQLAGPDSIIISDGSELVITVEGNADAVAALRFDRSGDRLSIARDQEIYDGSSRATVRITMPAPEELSIAGSGRIEAETLAQQADLEVAGSGQIIVNNVDSADLEVDIAGSGSVSGSGSAQQLDVSIAGSGDVRFNGLNAQVVNVDIAGSGDVAVASDGNVKANIAGSGDVVVSGNANCSVDSAGSGTLTCQPPATAVVEAEADGEVAIELAGDLDEVVAE